MTYQHLVIRRGASWLWFDRNPILLEGEEALETDTKRRKIGDGTSPWRSLAYEPTPEDLALAVTTANGYTDTQISLVNTGSTDAPDFTLVFENGLV